MPDSIVLKKVTSDLYAFDLHRGFLSVAEHHTAVFNEGGYDLSVFKSSQPTYVISDQSNYYRDSGNDWLVIEGTTGMVVARGSTRPAAVSQAHFRLYYYGDEKVRAILAHRIKQFGLSPRYKVYDPSGQGGENGKD